MTNFEYVVTTKEGKKKEGTIKAANKEEAASSIRKEGEIIISITEKKHGAWFIFGKPSMNTQEKIDFTKSLSTMIKVGLTITEALEILRGQAKNSGQKKMLDDILERINSGQSFAKTLKKYDNIFSALYINMVETAEESGNLSETLNRLTIQLEKDNEIRKRILTAFIYPGVIISITIIMAIGIVIFIMPKITDIFGRFDVTLPAPTRFLIAFSDFLTNQTLLAVGIVAAIIAAIIILPKLKTLKPLWHTIVLKLPIFGDLLVSANVARFARTINSLIKSGVPIEKSLRMTAAMLDNVLYKNVLEEASQKVEKGGKMGDSLGEHEDLFPQLATKMVYIGDKTGALEITTKHIAKLYEKNVESKTKNLSVLLEPILLVFMAAMVGGIALSIILPIYQLPNLLNK